MKETTIHSTEYLLRIGAEDVMTCLSPMLQSAPQKCLAKYVPLKPKGCNVYVLSSIRETAQMSPDELRSIVQDAIFSNCLLLVTFVSRNEASKILESYDKNASVQIKIRSITQGVEVEEQQDAYIFDKLPPLPRGDVHVSLLLNHDADPIYLLDEVPV